MRDISIIITIASIMLFTCCKHEKSIDQKADELLQKLTLGQKISLIHGNTMFGVASIDSLGIPALKLSDGPCGVREEINPNDWGAANWTNDSTSYFPSLTGMASSWNKELANQFGIIYGEEGIIRGKHIMLMPGINIHRTPLCGRNWEYLSEDPYLVSSIIVPLIKGIQSHDLAACVKHYALNNQEQDRGTINVEADERALREIYLPAFEAAVKDGEVLSLLGAYNRFRGEFACENDYLINTILKGEWGFKGLIMSDWGSTHNTIKAAKNGLDLEMGTNKPFDEYYMARPLLDSIKAGKVDAKVVDDKVRRILYVMHKINAIGNQVADTAGMQAKLGTKERGQRILKISEECAVLLKNTNNALPLDINKIKKIAVIGDNAIRKHAHTGWSPIIKARYEITPLEGLKNKLAGKAEVTYSEGYKVTDSASFADQKLLEEAVLNAKDADIAIVVCGLNHNMHYDNEGADKLSLSLPFGQDQLISSIYKANPNTIVILVAGGPVEMGEWLNDVPALLLAPYLGMEAGTAIANILFGDVNPSGKLSDTWGKKLTDWGSHALGEYPGNINVNYNDGILVGYRYFDTKKIEPLYPFGYGLSYTTFEYSNFSAPNEISADTDEFTVSFEVKNTGKVAGKEVAQLYIRDPESSLPRPTKELKGFEKVSLNPGESKKVEIKLNQRALQFYDPQQMKWIAEPGLFEILIGASSRDIKNTMQMILKD